MLIHLRQSDNKCLKCSGGISIPQRLELIGGHAGHFSEVLKGFTACGCGNLHFDQSLGEGRAAHFGFDADRGQRRSKAQNLRFGQTYLCTGSGQTHCHHHDGGFSRCKVVAQLNQCRAEVPKHALIHAGDVCKLCQRGCRFRSHNISTVAEVNHCSGELSQIIRADTQLAGDGNDFCDIVRRGSDLGRHALDLIRQSSEFFLGGVDGLAD